jgi:hypothetical protein
MKWRNIVYDSWTNLKQNFDDADISLAQVKYWVGVAANRLLMQHIEKRDSGAFKTRYESVPIQIESGTGYKYIELPKNIIDFNRDGGVDYMSYVPIDSDCTPPFTWVMFQRTSASAVRILYYTEEETPSPDNPYFYRIGNNLYLLGLECVDVLDLELCVYQTIDPSECNFDDEMEFPDELVAILQRYILDIGRFVLSVPKGSVVNDGNNNTAEVPSQKLMSVNDNPVINNQQQQE